MVFIGLGLVTGTWSWGFLIGWLAGSLGIWWLRTGSPKASGKRPGNKKRRRRR